MSVTVTQQITHQTVTVTGNPVENNVSVTVSNARGPAGESGTDFIDAATGSDGTANLSLLNVTTATAEVTGTLTAPHIHGNLAGSLYAHVRAGEDLAKGDPVYVSSSHGSGATLIAEVSKADASNAAKMPAVGIMDAAVSANANGHMVVSGTITELATNAYAINAELYVAAGGGMTATPPSARAQPVARVERSNANNGAILVKVNGLSASDATANTLVRRTSGGGASVAGITLSGLNTNSGSYSQVGGANFNVATTTAANLTATGSGTVTISGAGGTTISGGTLTFSPSGFAYGTGAADAHRTALGLGTGDSPTFANATFATGTITTSQPLALTQTWNNAATTFTGLQANITDTASNINSLLIDLQVGGASRLRVSKSGDAIMIGRVVTSSNSTSTSSPAIHLSTHGAGNPAGITMLSPTQMVLCTQGAAAFSVGLGALVGTAQAFFGMSNSASTANQTSDVRLYRDESGIFAQRNGGAAQTSRIYDTYTSATDFHRLAIATARATATAMSGSSVTLTNIIPAGAVVVGVTCKVTTAITGATSFDLGTATDVDRFGAGIAIALGATSDNRNWTSGTVECFPSATSLILTANGSNFTGGSVYVSVQYLSGQAD